MQDKEFYKLFQERFDSFEFEPSEQVWDSINNDLKRTGKKRSGASLFWMAAASVIVVFGAAIWFAPKEEKVWLRKEELAVRAKPQRVISPEKEEMVNAAQNTAMDRKLPKTFFARKVPGNRLTQKESSLPVQAKHEQAEEIVVEPIVELYSNEEVSITGSSLASAEVTLKEGSSGQVPVIAAIDAEQDDPVPKERNAKSIGDLVNFVVGKVDKRQDKIIQFKDTDEGSIVSGLNLGIVKIRSRN